MLIVGISVYCEEACRLLGIVPAAAAAPASIDALIAARTSLRLYFIDKGVCMGCLDVPQIRKNYWAPVRCVDECIALIIQLRKHEWLREVARLKLDMRAVTLAHM